MSCHPWYACHREASAEGELGCKRKEKTVSKGRVAEQLASLSKPGKLNGFRCTNQDSSPPLSGAQHCIEGVCMMASSSQMILDTSLHCSGASECLAPLDTAPATLPCEVSGSGGHVCSTRHAACRPVRADF